MPDTHAAPFSDLLSSAWAHVKERMNVLLPGIILFGILAAALQMPLMGIDEATAVPTPEQAGMLVILSLGSILASIIAYLYYLLAMTGKDGSVGTILRKTLPRIIPFIGLTLLIMLRTFAWVSLAGVAVLAYGGWVTIEGDVQGAMIFILTGTALLVIGTVCAFIFGPRYLLAPLLWVMEGSGVRDAVKRSHAVSTGYWGKILGNTLLLGLIFMIVSVAATMIAGIAGNAQDSLGMMLFTTLLSQFYNVIFSAFALKLAAEVIAHPRK